MSVCVVRVLDRVQTHENVYGHSMGEGTDAQAEKGQGTGNKVKRKIQILMGQDI